MPLKNERYKMGKWKQVQKYANHIPSPLQNYLRNKDKQSILNWFWKILPNAVLHLSYEENVPNGTNLLENLNGQIKTRLKTMRGIKSEKSLNNLLKILFYFRKYK